MLLLLLKCSSSSKAKKTQFVVLHFSPALNASSNDPFPLFSLLEISDDKLTLQPLLLVLLLLLLAKVSARAQIGLISNCLVLYSVCVLHCTICALSIQLSAFCSSSFLHPLLLLFSVLLFEQ